MEYRQGALQLLNGVGLFVQRGGDRLKLGHEGVVEQLLLVGHLRVHLRPRRAQERLDELLRAVRAVRGRLAQALGKLRLRLDQRRHQFAQRTQITALFRHHRSCTHHHQNREIIHLTKQTTTYSVRLG